MRFSISLSIALFMAWAVVLTACAPNDEANNPKLKKADEALADGQTELAKNFYLDYFNEHPNSWLVNRKLGGLYYDKLDRPEYAIFHFERCIVIDPRNEECAQLQSWCQEARRLNYEQLRREFNARDNAAKNEMEREILKLKRTNTELRMQLRSARVTNGPMPNAPGLSTEPTVGGNEAVVNQPVLSEAERRRQARERLKERLANQGTNVNSSTSTNGETRTGGPVPFTTPTTGNYVMHEIQPGETLSQISRKYFRTGLKVDAIINANPQIRGRVNNLRVGTKLKIPQS